MTEEAILNYLEKHQNGKWKSFGTTIDSIEWWDGVNPPEKNIIEEGVKVEQKIIDDTKYQRDRNYPDIGEQLDLLYHDMTSGKNDKTGEWYKAISKVKTDNPKSS